MTISGWCATLKNQRRAPWHVKALPVRRVLAQPVGNGIHGQRVHAHADVAGVHLDVPRCAHAVVG